MKHLSIRRSVRLLTVVPFLAAAWAMPEASATTPKTDLTCTFDMRIHFSNPITVSPSTVGFGTRQPGSLECSGTYRGDDRSLVGSITFDGVLTAASCASSLIDGTVKVHGRSTDGVRFAHELQQTGARVGSGGTTSGGDDELWAAAVTTVERFAGEDCITSPLTGGDVTGTVRVTERQP